MRALPQPRPVRHSSGWLYALLILLPGLCPAAAASESPWFATLGVSTISFSSSADLQGPQGRIPGAAIDIPDTQTLVAELGYALTPAVDLRFLLGVPPNLKAEGRGSLQAAGTLLEARIAPAMLSVTYQFNQDGRIRPYIGAGVAYIILKDWEARIDAGATRARVLKPGQAVTMEFDGARLNLEVDADDKVVALRCG